MSSPLIKKSLNIAQFIGIYFVSLVMIAFAVSKFFNAQFQIYNYSGYIPLKDLSLFTHAWSFFGRSYNYNLFIGIVEFFAGASILFTRTRLIGLLTAFILYVNILIIDIEFHVADALDHVIVEFIIVILLLLPYTKDLKHYFWNLAGKFTQPSSPSKRLLSTYLPMAFLLLTTAGFCWEMSSALKGQDQIIGDYSVKTLIVENDTISLRGGKNTKDPRLFFEFGNTFILSINDSAYWGDYHVKGDNIEMIFDKELYHFKNINARFNEAQDVITGQTNNNQSITLLIDKQAESTSNK